MTTTEPIPSGEPACRGKGFEHHERTKVIEVADRWQCFDCQDTGTYEALFKVCRALIPTWDALTTAAIPGEWVFLIPSDATPGVLGECFGQKVLRVRGLPAPMVGINPGG